MRDLGSIFMGEARLDVKRESAGRFALQVAACYEATDVLRV